MMYYQLEFLFMACCIQVKLFLRLLARKPSFGLLTNMVERVFVYSFGGMMKAVRLRNIDCFKVPTTSSGS